jgi:GNAT superfamily N-acetyltransferase
MTAMQIVQLTGSRDIDRFIRFPEAVYEGDPNWVPPFAGDPEFQLSGSNPFFRHADAAYFLAIEAGHPVGRIACFVDRNHINLHKEQAGFFGFFECMPDFHIAEKMIEAASSWLRGRSIDVMRGPVNPSMNDACGFLLEGFDSPPTVRMPYSPSRYLDYMEDCGLAKAKDLYAYTASIGDVASISRLEQVAGAVTRRTPGAVIRPIDRSCLPYELALIKDIYNSAWSRQWGFVPRTDAEIDGLAELLAPLIVPDLVLIVEVNGEAAGFLMALPDYNQVRGKVGDHRGFPGRLRLRWHARKITGMRVMTMGFKERFRRRGLDALLYLEAFRAARRKGYAWAEMSWVPEDNTLMRRGCELMGGKVTKRYRVFEKRISDR